MFFKGQQTEFATRVPSREVVKRRAILEGKEAVERSIQEALRMDERKRIETMIEKEARDRKIVVETIRFLK